MKAASISDIKKELTHRDSKELHELCLRLARYKKENKELLTYLLFEAHDEHTYVEGIKAELTEQFDSLQTSNLYFAKKGLRRILRLMNKQIKYSAEDRTEVELRICFCEHIKMKRIPLRSSQVIMNLYLQQIKKIDAALAKLEEDLQFDYSSAVDEIKSV